MDFTCPALTFPEITFPEITFPEMTFPALTSPDLNSPDMSFTLKTHYRLTVHTLSTPYKQPPYTHQTHSRQFPNTFQTPTRQSPKFRHVGSFPLLEARCGLLWTWVSCKVDMFFLQSGLGFLVWHVKTKPNSYSDQSKFLEVCSSWVPSRSGVWQ